MKHKNKCFSALSILAAVFLSFVLFASCGDPTGGESIKFISVTADGSATVTTTKLTLTFNDAVEGLSTGDITLAGSTGAVKGTLTAASTAGVYELTVTAITAGGSVSVTVSKDGYVFAPESREVTVYYSSANPNPPPGPDPNKYTVWFNTGFATPSAINPQMADKTGTEKITAPAALDKDGFTFKGWYTKYSVDSATGLWKYEDVDKWDFAADTVTQNMTLYAGWQGGVKVMPRSYIWAKEQSHLQGRLIQLEKNKTYKMGARYFLQPEHGPVYLQARYRPSGEGYTTEKSVTLQSAGTDNCFMIAEDEFTASYTGWYFIGVSNYRQGSEDTHGQYLLHEVWLKEKGGGDINLLPNGDFVWKDTASAKFHELVNPLDPFHEGGEPRTEWDADSWNMNKPYNNGSGVHMARDWDYVRTHSTFLYDLSGGKISAGNVAALVFPIPAHP